MFKVYISDSAYDRIISSEKQRATVGRSNLNKLLKQQPVQLLTEKETDSRYNYISIVKRPNDMALEFKKPYEIVTEVMGLSEGWDIYYKFHNRRIVSNYFVAKMDYSLAAFNKTEGASEQTIIPQVLFTEDGLNKSSSASLQSLQQITKALKSFSDSLKSPSMNHNSYSYAINGLLKDRCLTIINRLKN